jgi:hypothetical protein
MRPASLAGLLLACCVSAVSAQEPTVPTHWKTGLLIGGGAGVGR